MSKAALGLGLFLVAALACGPSERDVATARARFDSALAAHDVAGALGAIETLEAGLPETPESALELAQRLGRAGEMTRALWLLEGAAERYPRSVEIRLGLAETAIVVGAPEQALAVLDGLTTEGRADRRASLLRYRAQLALGDLEGALDTLEVANARHAGIEFAVARVAVLVAEKQYERALTFVRLVMARDELSDAERLWLRRSEVDLVGALGDPHAALALLVPLTVRATGDPDIEAWRRRAALLANDGRANDAVVELVAVTTEHADVPGLQAILANAYIAAGDRAGAESILRARWEQHATTANAINLADFLHRTGRSLAGAEVVDRQLAGGEGNRDLDIEVEYLRVALLLEGGDSSAARAHFVAFSRAYPDDPRSLYLRARFDLVDGRPEAAAMRLKQLLPRLDRADVHHWLAVALEQSGDDAGAEQRYGIAVYADPGQIPSYHGLLRTLASRGAWRQVEHWAMRLLHIAPDSTTAYEALVRARVALGEAAAAEALTRRYAERHPALLAPRIAMSIALRRQSRPGAALAALDAVRPSFGDAPEWIAERGIVLGQLGRGGEGLAAVNVSIGSHGDSRELRRARSFLLFSAGRGDEGLREVEALLQLAPDDPGPLQMAGDYFSLHGDFETARLLYERHLVARPRDAEVLFHLGIALAAAQEDDAAIDAYRRSAEAAPDSARARNNLALLLERQGRTDEALIAAQAAYARAQSDPSVLDTLGSLYLKAGRIERAVAILERAMRLDPTSVEVRYHVALAYREAGRDADARTVLDALSARTAPDHALALQIEKTREALSAPPPQ